MNFGVVLIALGGFLLGGAYSVAKLERLRPAVRSDPSQRARRLRPAVRLVVAAVLALLAVYLVVAGILRVGQE